MPALHGSEVMESLCVPGPAALWLTVDARAVCLRRGVQRLQCYAFACPPCMDQKLAADCKDYITAVALRDDVVARFSPQALARLNEELRTFNVEPAMQVLLGLWTQKRIGLVK